MADDSTAKNLENSGLAAADATPQKATPTEVKAAVSADKSEPEMNERNLDLILDIPLRVTVELGRTRMVVNELLNLGQGSVVELSKLAGEPLEVLVNNKLVARGEAVVVNEKFGVRLTDIISQTERVEQLG